MGRRRPTRRTCCVHRHEKGKIVMHGVRSVELRARGDVSSRFLDPSLILLIGPGNPPFLGVVVVHGDRRP
jgi:hypothetical protein